MHRRPPSRETVTATAGSRSGRARIPTLADRRPKSPGRQAASPAAAAAVPTAGAAVAAATVVAAEPDQGETQEEAAGSALHQDPSPDRGQDLGRDHQVHRAHQEDHRGHQGRGQARLDHPEEDHQDRLVRQDHRDRARADRLGPGIAADPDHRTARRRQAQRPSKASRDSTRPLQRSCRVGVSNSSSPLFVTANGAFAGAQQATQAS